MNKKQNNDWRETRFLASLLVFWTKHLSLWRHSGSAADRADLLTQLSAAYYDISEVGFSKLESLVKEPRWFGVPRIILWFVTWLPLAGWCHLRMSSVSDGILHLCLYSVEPLKNLTARQLEVRQRILRRRGRYLDAQLCIVAALEKSGIDPCIEGLLHVGQADCCFRLLGGRDWQEAAVGSLVQAVNLCPEGSDHPEFGRFTRDLSVALKDIHTRVGSEVQGILDTLLPE